ncbi:MAG: RNA 2',3'-cyclic phosphodiesterase [Bacteroidales bacterium]|nr:RNA 2',3'-cyclic phosphodiesterase [Bacteroidales bacterium]
MEKRLFTAIHIPAQAALKDFYAGIRETLGSERIRWVDTGQLHLTLKFFGGTDESLVPLISRITHSVVSNHGAFSMTMKGMGVFGSRYDPRVIWLGFDTNERMSLLADELLDALAREGFPRDRQNFLPHLTIGRIKGLRDRELLRELTDTHRDTPLQKVEVRELILFESILHRHGPEYIPLEVFPLTSPGERGR